MGIVNSSALYIYIIIIIIIIIICIYMHYTICEIGLSQETSLIGYIAHCCKCFKSIFRYTKTELKNFRLTMIWRMASDIRYSWAGEDYADDFPRYAAICEKES